MDAFLFKPIIYSIKYIDCRQVILTDLVHGILTVCLEPYTLTEVFQARSLQEGKIKCTGLWPISSLNFLKKKKKKISSSVLFIAMMRMVLLEKKDTNKFY